MELIATRVSARMVTLVMIVMLMSMNVSPPLASTVSLFYGDLQAWCFMCYCETRLTINNHFRIIILQAVI